MHARRAIFLVVIVVIILVGGEILLISELGSPFPVDVVVSNSMMPTFQTGDLVLLQKVQFSDIHVGDVIAFLQPSSGGGCTRFNVLHRVVAVTPQGLITQGDDRSSSPAPDEPGQFPPVTAACVQGKVVFAIPYVGLLLMSIPLTADYLLLVLVVLFVLFGVLRSRGKRLPTNPILAWNA
jgi:signal peptidase I